MKFILYNCKHLSFLHYSIKQKKERKKEKRKTWEKEKEERISWKVREIQKKKAWCDT